MKYFRILNKRTICFGHFSSLCLWQSSSYQNEVNIGQWPSKKPGVGWKNLWKKIARRVDAGNNVLFMWYSRLVKKKRRVTLFFNKGPGWYLVISKVSSIDNWSILLDILKMVNIVGLYAAAQGGLCNKCRAVTED